MEGDDYDDKMTYSQIKRHRRNSSQKLNKKLSLQGIAGDGDDDQTQLREDPPKLLEATTDAKRQQQHQ